MIFIDDFEICNVDTYVLKAMHQSNNNIAIQDSYFFLRKIHNIVKQIDHNIDPRTSVRQNVYSMPLVVASNADGSASKQELILSGPFRHVIHGPSLTNLAQVHFWARSLGLLNLHLHAYLHTTPAL
jgi:type II secretory pathway component GspD/PulD (secretin)